MSRKRRQSIANDEVYQANSAPKKRRRQYTEADSKLAELYENLASEIKDVRMKAAKDIIQQLSPESGPSSEAVKKALIRLIRGLCSNRKAARFGFFVAFTEILRQLFSTEGNQIEGLDISVGSIIDLVTERTKPEARVSGQEKKDHSIGRIFGYKAIMQSSILVQPHTPTECWVKVLDHISKLACDIPWLREECGLILCDAVKSLESGKAHESYIQEIVQRLTSYNLARTPEGIAVWLTIRSSFSENVLPENIWHNKDPLCTKERRLLAKVLKENFHDIEPQDDSKKIKSGFAHSSPSFAWDVVLVTMLERTANPKEDAQRSEQSDFDKFWIQVVDDNLFSSSASLERKAWGFQILGKMVTAAPEWAIPGLFSPNLMRSLINHRNNSERFLHNAAMVPLKELQARVQKDPGIAASIVVALTSKNGTVKLDQLTKTKTLENILLLADDKALLKIVKHFHALILCPDNQEQTAADSYRRMIADILITLVKGYKGYQNNSTILPGKESWLRNIFVILVEFAFFVPNSSASRDTAPLPPISASSRIMFRERLSSCLAHLVAVTQPDQLSFPSMVVSIIRQRIESFKTLDIVFEADKTVLKMQRSTKENRNATANALILLYSLAILQVYNGDADAVSILSELDICYESIFGTQNSVRAEGFDILIEVLLSFLTKPSSLFRKLAEQVFTTFTADITSEGLRTLIEILEKGENLAGQQDLFDQGVDEVEDDDDDDLEDASDVEMVGISSADSTKDDSNHNSEEDEERDSDRNFSSDDDDDKENGQKDEELAKFDAMLAEALKTSGPADGATMADDTSDGEDMDDEEMMALEPHLARIFRERRNITSKKKEKKDARQAVINFKNRVLDLLLIYVKKQHANPLALQLILPLLRLVGNSTSKQVAEKSFGLLKEYFDACKGKELPRPDEGKELLETLKKIHLQAKTNGSKMHGNACSRSSIFIVKILVALDESNYERAVDVYSESQKQWYRNANSQVQPALFTEWINWSVNTRKSKKLS
ncbi:hypothetical protein K432DRAFT_300397 [Lepidopterella palustris CBS 459.81]|uniref:DNA polymerase V n=1 Tax=Lepidopterella palustris CBS 459.81 TaxID=1314670 RepID=A0A8E2E8E6_9PEZI|nr:hypothetical protein K432DRAFT_300397 [Lepidopterella palustris CBS 459.81]